MAVDNHFRHESWQDTDELTPPPALQNPLVVTDYEVEGIRQGPDGQTITGYWEELPDQDGRTTANGDEVWRVLIDGRGGDVWLRPNRPDGGAPEDIDFSITIENARHVRLTGVEAFVDDIRTVNGYHPDDRTGQDQLVNIRDIAGSVFIEGADIDMNWGGNSPTFRTDALSAYELGDRGDPLDQFTLQNSRIVGVSSTLRDPASHADALHFQSDAYIEQFASENVFGTTRYQFFMMNYEKMIEAGAPAVHQHSRFYNTQIENLSDAPTLFLDPRDSGFSDFMSLEFDNTYIYTGDSRRTSVYTNSIYDYGTDDEFLKFKNNFLTARSDVRQADGDLQPQMVSGEDELHILHERWRMPDAIARADNTGVEYDMLWAQDGALLDEEVTITVAATEAAVGSLLGWYDKATGAAEVLFADTNEAGGQSRTIHAAEIERVGLFVIPDGGANFAAGGGLAGADPTALAFRLGQRFGDYVIETTDGRPLDGHLGDGAGRAPFALLIEADKNPDGFDYARETSSGTIRWETVYGGGDADFNDLVIEVSAPVNGASVAANGDEAVRDTDANTPQPTDTGLDVLVDIILSDPLIANDLPLDTVLEGAAAAAAMNDLIVDAIVATGTANDGDITFADVRDLSDHLNRNHLAEWRDLHGDDGRSSGFHVLTDARNETELFGLKAINLVADNIYHLGFGYDGSRLLDQDGGLNAPFEKIEEFLTEMLADDLAGGRLANPELDFVVEPTTGTGLDRFVDIIQSDPLITTDLSVSTVAEGATAVTAMNELIVEAVVATDVADDGRISSTDVRDLSDHLNRNHLAEWRDLHGDDGRSSGFHVLTDARNETELFGLKAINRVADNIYHLGFGYDGSRLLDQDGELNAPFDNVARFLDGLLAEDLADGSLATWDGPIATTSTTVNETAPYLGDVRYSTDPDRSLPLDLDGATISRGETLYAFVDDADSRIAQVEFLLNGASIQTENYAPWDINGGRNNAANGLATSDLAAGTYTLESRITFSDDGSADLLTLTDTFQLVA